MGFSDIKITILISTLLILLLIAGVVITIFISNRRNAEQEMKMAQLQVDYEKELRTVQHEVQEQVLTNVARELHDNIGQLLTVMNIQLEQQKVINPATSEALRPVGKTLIDTIQEVRRLSRSLNSDLVDVRGLIHTIDHEVARLTQLNVCKVHWEYDTEPFLSKDQKVIAFRIFQEMLNNTLKHANAANIYIALSGTGHFKMELKDDGQGFNMEEMQGAAKGSGLKNMVKRAELAKMKCNISSAINKGTIFTLEQSA